TLCLCGGLIRLLTSALTASLYPRIGHVLKPPDGRIKGVTSFLNPGALHLILNYALKAEGPTIKKLDHFNSSVEG
ncbi:hypothetical protein, partial [Synechococcus sp. RedBA-s]|uniref:hypothetical protein n=1 Tax=Synechococcus sp. RedBA-s TaxID=2823741 RepID=UPI0020CE8166